MRRPQAPLLIAGVIAWAFANFCAVALLDNCGTPTRGIVGALLIVNQGCLVLGLFMRARRSNRGG